MEELLLKIQDMPTLVTGGIGMFAMSFIVGFLVKKVNSKKWIKATLPVSTKMAQILDVLLARQLGKDTAEKLEEGLFGTICNVLIANIENFKKVLFKNNKK